MWECCLCHLHNTCVLIVLYKELIGQEHKIPQIQLRYIVFCFQNYQTQQYFLQTAWQNNEKLYKNKIICFDDNYYPEVQKIWRHVGAKQNQLRKRGKVLHFIILMTKMGIIL